MHTLKFVSFLFVVLFLQNGLPVQDKLNIKFGKVKSLDVDIIPTYPDSINGVSLMTDASNSIISANKYQFNFHLVVAEKKRKKIIDENSFHAVTIIIPPYVGENDKVEKTGNHYFNFRKLPI